MTKNTKIGFMGTEADSTHSEFGRVAGGKSDERALEGRPASRIEDSRVGRAITTGITYAAALGVAGSAVGLSASAGDKNATELAQKIATSDTPYHVMLEGKRLDVVRQCDQVMSQLQRYTPKNVTLSLGEHRETISGSHFKTVLDKMSALPNIKVCEAIGRGKVVDSTAVQKR